MTDPPIEPEEHPVKLAIIGSGNVGTAIACAVTDAGHDADVARHLEGMALLNIALNARNGWSWGSGWKLVGALS